MKYENDRMEEKTVKKAQRIEKKNSFGTQNHKSKPGNAINMKNPASSLFLN